MSKLAYDSLENKDTIALYLIPEQEAIPLCRRVGNYTIQANDSHTLKTILGSANINQFRGGYLYSTSDVRIAGGNLYCFTLAPAGTISVGTTEDIPLSEGPVKIIYKNDDAYALMQQDFLSTDVTGVMARRYTSDYDGNFGTISPEAITITNFSSSEATITLYECFSDSVM